MANNNEDELKRFENYSLRRLAHSHSSRIVQLYSNENSKREPMSLAYFQQFPELQNRSLADWTQYCTLFIKDLIDSKASVGIFDLAKNERLVGVCLVKNVDYNAIYSNFDKKHFMYAAFLFGEELYSLFSKEDEQKMGKSIDIWGVAIEEEYNGKRLLGKMIGASEYLASLMGFQYSSCWSSNFRTAIALKRLGYDQIAQLDVAQFEHEGVRHFRRIDQMSKVSTVWLKKINSVHSNELMEKSS